MATRSRPDRARARHDVGQGVELDGPREPELGAGLHGGVQERDGRVRDAGAGMAPDLAGDQPQQRAAVVVGQERDLTAADVLVAGRGHLQAAGQVHPELDAVEGAADGDDLLRGSLLVEDPAARGHPLRVAIGDHAAATVGVLVLEGAVEHVGDGLEPAVRVPRRAPGRARLPLHLAHLVHVDERVEIAEVDAGEGAAHGEALALVALRGGGDGAHRPFDGGGGVRIGDAWEHEDVVDGDGRHGSSFGCAAPHNMVALATIPGSRLAARPGPRSRASAGVPTTPSAWTTGNGRWPSIRAGVGGGVVPLEDGGEVIREAAPRGVGVPGSAPEHREVAAVAPPDRRAPLAEVEVGEGMVDAGGLPVEDAREGVRGLRLHEQLALVEVAVDEHRLELPRSEQGPFGRPRLIGLELELDGEGRDAFERLPPGERRHASRDPRRATAPRALRARRTGRRARRAAWSSTIASSPVPREPIEHHHGVRRHAGVVPHRLHGGDHRRSRGRRWLGGRRRRAASGSTCVWSRGKSTAWVGVSSTSFDQPVKSASIGSSSPRPRSSRKRGSRGGAITASAGWSGGSSTAPG